jgi:hypothetical protein
MIKLFEDLTMMKKEGGEGMLTASKHSFAPPFFLSRGKSTKFSRFRGTSGLFHKGRGVPFCAYAGICAGIANITQKGVSL